MSDTNRVSLAYVEETTYGVIEPGNPNLQEVPMTGESLRQETATVVSATIRADRNIPDTIRTGLSAAGEVNFEFNWSAFDDWLVATLMEDTATPWPGTEDTVIAANVNVEVTDTNTITLTSGTWTTTPTAGEWIEVRGFTGSPLTNNGYFKVIAATTTTIDVAGARLVADAAGESVSITQLVSIKNGTTLRTYNIERAYTDLASTFAVLLGMAIDQFAFAIPSDGIITGSFTFLGKTENSGSATIGDGTNTAAPTTDIMNGIDNVPDILVGHAQADSTAITLQLQNNLRARLQIGTLGAISIGTGNVNVSGTQQRYFDTNTMLDAYRNFTATALAIVLEDNDGNGYIFDLPRIKFTSGQAVASGQNDDVIADLAWQAVVGTDAWDADVTIRIARFTSTSV